jgi:hypothetical protein
VDAPGQTRRVVNFKRLALTDFKLELPRLAPKKVVTAKFAEAGECGGRWSPVFLLCLCLLLLTIACVHVLLFRSVEQVCSNFLGQEARQAGQQGSNDRL